MKLICDCGNEMEFNKYKDLEIRDFSNFVIHGEHNVAWLICKKCSETIMVNYKYSYFEFERVKPIPRYLRIRESKNKLGVK